MALGPVGGAFGREVAAPTMNTLNSKANIKAFAKKFTDLYGTKDKALAEFKFGTFTENGEFTIAQDLKPLYLTDVNSVGDLVKKKWVKTLVDNYFSADPLPMKFSLGGTATPGGNIIVGQMTEAIDEDPYISVRVLCHILPVTNG